MKEPIPQTTKTWAGLVGRGSGLGGDGGRVQQVPQRPIRTCRSRGAPCRWSGACPRRGSGGGLGQPPCRSGDGRTGSAHRLPRWTGRWRGPRPLTGTRHFGRWLVAGRAEARARAVPWTQAGLTLIGGGASARQRHCEGKGEAADKCAADDGRPMARKRLAASVRGGCVRLSRHVWMCQPASQLGGWACWVDSGRSHGRCWACLDV